MFGSQMVLIAEVGVERLGQAGGTVCLPFFSPKTTQEPLKRFCKQTKKIKSIQDDPDASDAYKSLFNTCEKAKNQQKAHWTTYNPLYN